MEISTLEKAAETLLAPPDVVSAEERKVAEQFFHNLKKELNVNIAKNIIQNSSNQFVLFQVGQMLGEVVLRQWSLLDAADVQTTYRMLLEYVASNESVSNYVTSEYLRSVAMIIKRGILDKKTGEDEELFETVHNLLTSSSPRLQTIGCQLISALTEQFASSWRNAKFSITWDFYLRAKAEFESSGLRRLLEMSLQTLHQLSMQDDLLTDPFKKRLCSKFLEVTEGVFSWNFSSRLFRRIFSVNQTTNSFRPPGAWRDLLSNDEFFTLFFKLHSKVRTDEELSTRSLSCLVQLAGLAGDCVDDNFSNHFLALYVDNLLQVFAQGPLPHEVNSLCTIFNRLVIFRPPVSLLRLPVELRNSFFSYLAQYIQHLTNEAVSKAIGSGEHDDHTSLALLFDCWIVLLRARWRWNLENDVDDSFYGQFICEPTFNIAMNFLRNVQGPPHGVRPKASDDDDNEEDDRKLFSDLLTPLGTICCHRINDFMRVVVNTLNERINELQGMATGADISRLPDWQEDMHWLMLILANSLVNEEADGTCGVDGDVFDHSIDLATKSEQKFNDEVKTRFLCACLEQPTAYQAEAENLVDPFVLVCGQLLRWCALEHELVKSAAPHFISPELTRSSLLCLKRFLNAGSTKIEQEGNEVLSLPYLPLEGPFAEMIVPFTVHKVFTILSKFSGEEKLCNDAVQVLIGMVESRSVQLASSPALFEAMGALDIARLPCRKTLMTALVLVGTAASDQTVQENMCNKILEPLASRFIAVCQIPPGGATDSELVDLIECFDGIALASLQQSAKVLFNVLSPVLTNCAHLMTSHARVSSVVAAILTLLKDITTKVSIYIDDQNEVADHYRTILTIIDSYRNQQQWRFVGMASDDEEKSSELVLFMEILSNVMSKDILESNETNVATGAQVAAASLEMLLSIMNESLLEVPEVALKFYRVVLYLMEFSPEAMQGMSLNLLCSICDCLQVGISSRFGLEITSTSLEAFSELVNYFAARRESVDATLAQKLIAAIPNVFETCLENSCENNIFCEAASSIFALVCFSREDFNAFVNDLLLRKSNEAAAERLRVAFTALLPQDGFSPSRKEKVAFRQRMEKFVQEVQGLLSCN